jgi:hypothetical protein
VISGAPARGPANGPLPAPCARGLPRGLPTADERRRRRRGAGGDADGASGCLGTSAAARASGERARDGVDMRCLRQSACQSPYLRVSQGFPGARGLAALAARP